MDINKSLRTLMIDKLFDVSKYAREVNVRVRFEDKKATIDNVDYVNLPDDKLFEFYNLIMSDCSQPRI